MRCRARAAATSTNRPGARLIQRDMPKLPSMTANTCIHGTTETTPHGHACQELPEGIPCSGF